MKVCLDYGHGGFDSGCIGGDILEKDIVKKIGKTVRDLLIKNNVTVIETRKDDEYISLQDRCNISNKNNCDIFVSIHVNAYSNTTVNGLESYNAPNSVKGLKLSTSIYNSIVDKKLYNNLRGLKENNYTVLTNTNAPACLIELGFLTNIKDRNLIVNKQYDYAKAVTQGILNYIGLKSNNVDDSNKIYRVQTGAFKNKFYADNLKRKISKMGYDVTIINDNGLYKVQVGAFKCKSNADNLKDELYSNGIKCFII